MSTGPTPPVPTYRIDGESFTCLLCNNTSFHPQDVLHLFCGYCHVFHHENGVLEYEDLP